MEQKNDFKFGDPIWICIDCYNDIAAVYIRSVFGCAVVATDASTTHLLHVNPDMIRHREVEPEAGAKRNEDWISFPEQQPRCDTPYIVSIRDDSEDSVRHYTDVGWRSSSFLQNNAWIVDNEVNFNVIAWMPLPKPYEEKENN